MQWYKGNLHCHSTESDGSVSPVDLAKFYNEIGYDFIGISDHNRYTPIEVYADEAGILGIPCCEFTGKDSCHVVAAGVKEAVTPDPLEELLEQADVCDVLKQNLADSEAVTRALILQNGIDKTLAAQGIPIICHPFWRWTYRSQEVVQLRECTHFELCNACPDCNSFPLPGKSHADDMWDELLSADIRIIAMASDDAHRHVMPSSRRDPVGGSGFNVVRAESLTQEHILQAVRDGHCYATTGIILANYRVLDDRISVEVDVQQQEKTCIQFFGLDGSELQTEYATHSEYCFSGDETYVRCRIASTTGLWAWTQPVFMDDLNTAIAWTA